MKRIIYEAALEEQKTTEVHVGHDNIVEIHKYYGSLCADGVRIRMDLDTAEWIVEREDTEHGWIEKARWHCQEDFG